MALERITYRGTELTNLRWYFKYLIIKNILVTDLYPEMKLAAHLVLARYYIRHGISCLLMHSYRFWFSLVGYNKSVISLIIILPYPKY